MAQIMGFSPINLRSPLFVMLIFISTSTVNAQKSFVEVSRSTDVLWGKKTLILGEIYKKIFTKIRSQFNSKKIFRIRGKSSLKLFLSPLVRFR